MVTILLPFLCGPLAALGEGPFDVQFPWEGEVAFDELYLRDYDHF